MSKLFIDHHTGALPALRTDLERATTANRSPIASSTSTDTVDCTVGLSGLCFERHWDFSKIEPCQHVAICTSKLDPLLRDHRIPLFTLGTGLAHGDVPSRTRGSRYCFLSS